MIENLICIKENNLLHWASGESNRVVSMPFLDHAMVDSTRQLVFACRVKNYFGLPLLKVRLSIT